MTIAATRVRTRTTVPEVASPVRAWMPPAIIMLAAIVAWAIALPSLRAATWNVFGLLAASSPLFSVSLVLIAVAFCLAIGCGATRTAGTALIARVLLLRLPTAV